MLHTIMSWALMLGQFLAIYLILRITPMLIVSIIRTIRFKDIKIGWADTTYTHWILSIMYLLIVGLPKF